MRIQCLQHVAFEGPGAIAGWAERRGHELTVTRLYEDQALPPVDALDLCIVMGGPMNVYQDDLYPWLRREREFLSELVDAGRPVVGICLGAQLLADVLGARVYRGAHREIGWFPVEVTRDGRACGLLEEFPDRMEVFHWHGDTFDLPHGALHLMRSEACENQSFLYDGRILGLQFHLEVTPAGVSELVRHCEAEMVPGPYVQDPGVVRAATAGAFQPLHAALASMLDRLPVAASA